MNNLINKEFNPTQFPNPRMISVNGIELEVFEAGQQNKEKPIVLCHGFPEHAFSWRYQIRFHSHQSDRFSSRFFSLWQM